MTDFWMVGVNQGSDLDFNSYLLIFFNGACSSNIDFTLSKNDSIDRFTSCCPNWRTSDHSLSK